MIGGKRVRESYPTLEEATLAAQRLLRLKEDTPKDSITLAQLCEESLAIAKQELKPATVEFWREKYGYLLRAFDRNTPAHALTTRDLEYYLDSLNVSGTSVRMQYDALSKLLRFAVRQGYAKSNPLDPIKKPKDNPTRLRSFTSDEINDIVRRIRSSDNRKAREHADMVEFFWYTGLRREEASRLAINDIDLRARLIYPKGKNNDEALPICDALVPVLERLIKVAARPAKGDVRTPPGSTHKGRPAALFPRGRYHIATVFRRWRERLGLKCFSPHAMRHSFATARLRRGNEETPLLEPTSSRASQLRLESPRTGYLALHPTRVGLHQAPESSIKVNSTSCCDRNPKRT